MSDRWHIRLLGRLSATRREERIERFRTRSAGVLLAYIAFYRDRAHSRDEVVYHLWPEDDPEIARRKLRVELSSLRRQLEPPGTPAGTVIQADRTEVRLHPYAVSTDVQQFFVALAEAERPDRPPADLWARAVSVYGGELLPGHSEEWILQERKRLQDRFCGALREMSRALETGGDVDAAADGYRRLLGIDPFREEVHRDLIRLYAVHGRRPQALKQYEELCAFLTSELRTHPSRATQELMARVQEGTLCMAPAADEAGRRRVEAGIAPAQAAPAPVEIRGPGRLPAAVNRFIGREKELSELAAWLAPDQEPGDAPMARIVTLTGPGGVGKSRLALEAARILEARFSEVHALLLSDLPPGEPLVPALLATLGGEVPEGIEPRQFLAHRLSGTPILLLLDGAEHGVEPVAELVGQLLRSAPRLRCLVTSRQVLNLHGELELSLAPLPLPEPDAGLAQLAANESIRLFLDRARQARPDLQLTAANAGELRALCGRLEGLPLALELAAARIRLFGIPELLERVERRFDLLVGRTRDLPPRHRSLRETIHWSYDLLSPEHRTLFTALSLFRGGGTLAAVAAVTALPHAVDALQVLREASLIRIETAGESRFNMLDSIREFAADQADPLEMDELRLKWAAHYAEMALRQVRRLYSAEDAAVVSQLERERENLQAAAAWATSHGEHRLAAQLGLGLGHLLHRRGLITEARQHVEASLRAAESDPDADPETLARLRMLSASVLLDCQELDLAARETDRLLEIAVARGAADLQGAGYNLHGLMARARGERDAARGYFSQALAAGESAGDDVRSAMALNNLGIVEDEDPEGDPARARDYLERAYHRFRKCGYRRGEAEALTNLGALAQVIGEPEVACRCYTQALEIELEHQHVFGVGRLLFNLGETALERGESEPAIRRLAAARTILEWAGSPHASVAEELLEGLDTTSHTLPALLQERHGHAWSAVEQLAHWALGGS